MEAALGLHSKMGNKGGDSTALAQLASKQPSALMERKLDEQVRLSPDAKMMCRLCVAKVWAVFIVSLILFDMRVCECVCVCL